MYFNVKYIYLLEWNIILYGIPLKLKFWIKKYWLPSKQKIITTAVYIYCYLFTLKLIFAFLSMISVK